MNENSATSSKPRRRWLRFSLRTFFIVITLLCVLLGIKTSSAVRQKEAVNAIRNAGGTVTYSYQFVPVLESPDKLKFDPQAEPPCPAWLCNIFGVDFFSSVVSVDITSEKAPGAAAAAVAHIANLPDLRGIALGPSFFDLRNPRGTLTPLPIQDIDLKCLENLTHLDEVSLSIAKLDGSGLRYLTKSRLLKVLDFNGYSNQFSDLGLTYIGTFEELENLDLEKAQISDEGLKSLRNLKHLRFICLSKTNISDVGFAQLQATQAEILYLDGTRIGDDSMRKLGQMIALYKLNLAGTNVTDAGLQYLNCPQLKVLWIPHIRVGAAGLEHLVHLRNLETLGLSDTEITDEDLKYLKDLPHLSELYLSNTHITDAGLRHLAAIKTLFQIDLTGTRNAQWNQRFEKVVTESRHIYKLADQTI